MVLIRSSFPIYKPEDIGNASSSICLDEDTPIGTIIGTLYDPRPGEEETMTPHYFLPAEERGYKPDNEYFTIDENNNIILNTPLNYETKKSYDLTYNGTGIRDLKLSGVGQWDIKVSVNDPTPSLHNGKFEDFLVKQIGGQYQIIRKQTITRDGIVLPGGMQYLLNGVEKHQFDDVMVDVLTDIHAIFDSITGVKTESAEIFRLYKAAFDRFPDASGFKYWVDNYISGQNSSRVIAASFLESDEFKSRYGENTSNEKYVETLYENVLDREYDQLGYDYWVGSLNQGNEERYEVLLGFSESNENLEIFKEQTNIT